MKRENGVTLTSLIIYVVVMIIVVGIISIITKYYYNSLNEINKNVDASKEYTKLNSYLSEDVNNPYNIIYYCDSKSVTFYNTSNVNTENEEVGYNQYTFEGDSIYFNKIKICRGIETCEFILDEENKKEKFTLNIKFKGEDLKTTKYAIRREIGINLNIERKLNVSEAIAKGKILSTTKNTELEDDYMNKIVVPAGFKVTNDAETVDKGIVVEDIDGNQFVWIPVGEISNGTETKTIELNRYAFDTTTGEPTKKNEESIYNTDTIYWQELRTSPYGNTTAQNIVDFILSVSQNGGYYIARYEARDAQSTNERTSSTSQTNEIALKKELYVYNYISQTQAANLAKNMYSSTLFTTDLMNSYAWDTAVVFEQNFDNRSDTTTPYSLTKTSNTSLLSQGDNTDVICNIYGMASNLAEWSTETSSNNSKRATARGGIWSSPTSSVSGRITNEQTLSEADLGFRPILYLNTIEEELQLPYNYVREGLELYYDGEYNEKEGHNNNATTWKDLSGNYRHANILANQWNDNSLNTSNEDLIIPINQENNESITIDVTFCDRTATNYTNIMSSRTGWGTFYFHTWSPNNVFYIGVTDNDNGRFLPSNLNNTSIFKDKIYNVIYTYDISTQEAKVYLNGELLGTKTFLYTPQHTDIFRSSKCNKDLYRVNFYKRVLSEDEAKSNYQIDKLRFNIE